MPTIPYKQLKDENGDSFYPVCGASSFSDAVPIIKGGTGAQTAEAAASNLGFVEGNGYIKFPNGTLIQWGRTTSITVAGSSTANTAIAFSPAFYETPMVYACVLSSIPAQRSATASGASTTGCTVYFQNTTTSSVGMDAHWLAIGRWKAA